jgi:NAD+ kinase
MKALLFGPKASSLVGEVKRFPSLTLVDHEPEVVISYGGDGTLLSAERQWPGVPKVPIRNSRRGNRMLPHPPTEILRGLVEGRLVPVEFIKLECALSLTGAEGPPVQLVAMNEFNVHMAHVNAAVRFKVWINGQSYGDGLELIGDGFVASTPFGSTAYYNHITRGIFYQGLGLAFKYVAEHTTHLVLPEDTEIRVQITRGPAVLAYDSAPEYHGLEQGAELVIRRASQPAVILSWSEGYRHPSQLF